MQIANRQEKHAETNKAPRRYFLAHDVTDNRKKIEGKPTTNFFFGHIVRFFSGTEGEKFATRELAEEKKEESR